MTPYDPSLYIVIVSDASCSGIRTVIYHIFLDGDQKTIAHASKSLIPAEGNYFEIEKEALAIDFATKTLYKLLYGHNFTLITD